MNTIFKTEFEGRDITIATGHLAGQADGTALVTYGETVVLVTAVSLRTKREGTDFLPLTVDYQEMTAAAGKIPGGFFKREGRPNEREILTSRIIDRSIRPLFPKGYFYETQIVATLLSYDGDNSSDVAAMLGTSAALTMSDIPFKGPVAGIRVGRVEGRLVCNPSLQDMEQSDLDLFLVGRKIVPGTGDGEFDVNLVMLEGGAREIGEDIVLEAIDMGLKALRPVIELQDQVRAAIGKEKRELEPLEIEDELRERVRTAAFDGLRRAYTTARKQDRQALLADVRKKVMEECGGEEPLMQSKAEAVFEEIERSLLRDMIIQEKKRIDDRTNRDIRPIQCEVGLLPRTHGSALFTRGETQSLAVLTLGTSADEQRMDYVGGEEMRSFILHYNFPPYSVGEARFLRGPGRREIGHGALARRALLPVMPSPDDFPYTVRIVSEILSSNGSSSMATVCSGSLSLMDAGVPVKDVVAGIAMGLLKQDGEIVILSDILGDEDHAGDMDFKVCGTKNGITALQMDIKIDGITGDVLRDALYQAKEGRFFIIDKLRDTISEPRANLSVYAPRITTITINPERIRDVIGTGGKNIRQIISETGAEINVEDDGTVMVASNNEEAALRAIAMIRALTEDAEVGKIYLGTVKRVVDFGAFVEILPGIDGLVHISQLENRRVNKVTDVIREGDQVPVKVIDIDRNGKIKLSRKEALEETGRGKEQ
ncbi:MAG: polyribonucleotide nucleotidyltransferase [Deltaproteobacteria bacterium]|nr:polyribonucleotide nucleotidyltransferase [Deltaproteobacteria bacterium]